MTPNALAAFPRRELELRRRITGIPGLLFGVIGGVLILAGALWTAWEYVPGLLADAELQRNGEYAADGRIGGRCTTHRHVLTTCNVDVHYQTQDKAWLDHEIHIMTLGSLDQNTPLEIRYDRNHPESVGISWGFVLLTNRWITFGVMEALLLTFAVFAVMAGVKARKTALSLAAAVQRPEPIAVTITKGVRARRAVTWFFHWTQDGRVRKGSGTVRGGDTRPFFLDAGANQALALLGPDGRAHLLRSDLDPVVLTDSERRVLQDAVARGPGAPSPAGGPTVNIAKR